MMGGKPRFITCCECWGQGEIEQPWTDKDGGTTVKVECKECAGHGGWNINFELLASAPAQAERIAELEAVNRNVISILEAHLTATAPATGDTAILAGVMVMLTEVSPEYKQHKQALDGAEGEA